MKAQCWAGLRWGGGVLIIHHENVVLNTHKSDFAYTRILHVRSCLLFFYFIKPISHRVAHQGDK